MLFKRIMDWATSITAFRSGDVIPVDGPSGTAKMPKDSLLQEAADAALAGCLAPAFDETQAYKKYDYVIYNGKYYRFKTDRAAGAWNSSHVDVVDEDDLVLKVKAIPSTDLNDYNEVGVYEVSGTYTNMPSGEAAGNNGMLVVFITRTSRKLQLLQFSESDTNSKSRIYFRSGEYGGNTWAKWAKLQDMGEALANIAPLFDGTRTNSNPYKVNEWVVYNNALYKFTSEHYGAWNASHASAITLTDNVFRLRAQPSTDLNNYNATGIYEVNWTFTNYPSGETRNGLLAVFFARGSRKFQVLQVGANTASSPSVLYFRVGENGNNTYGKWEQIINADNLRDACLDTERIMAYRSLSANTDLNDCTACGYYSLSTQYTFTNTPPNWGYGFVVVYAMAGRQLQVAYDQSNNKVYQRSYASGAWGGWYGESSASCNISKVGGSWTIVFGDYKTKLEHKVNENKHQDTYNFPVVYKLDDTVVCPYGTDIIGPAKLATDDDFIGGVHGYCTTDPDTLKVIVDGVVCPLTNDMNISGSSITLMFTEVVMSKTTLQEVWTRDIEATFTKNEILISSKYTITSSTDQVIYRLTNGGLFAVWHQDLGGAWMNTKSLCPIPSTSIADSESAKNIVCEFLSPLGKVRVENILGHELPTYKGWWQNFQNENPPRLKSYFDLIKGDTTVHPGDVFVGSARYSFTPV